MECQDDFDGKIPVWVCWCFSDGKKVFELEKWMNRRYTQERVEKILSGSIFYKLNRRAVYRKENVAGQQTIYGYLVDGEESGRIQ